MLSFFREKSAISVFWLIFLTLGLHIPFIYHASTVVTSANDGLLYYVLQPLKSAGSLTVSCLYILIVILVALQINAIVNNIRLLPYANYIPALSFVLLTALLPQWSSITPALLSCFLICWIYYLFCRLSATSSNNSLLYNTGLLCGIATLCYYSLFILILISVVSLLVIRTLRIKELIIMLCGILTPFYLLAGILFCMGGLKYFMHFRNLFQPHIILFQKKDILLYITLAAVLLLSLYGLLLMNSSVAKVHIQTRKSWQLVFAFFVLLPVVIWFRQSAWPLVLIMAVVPASLYISIFFAGRQRIAANIVFWLLTGLALYNGWVTA